MPNPLLAPLGQLPDGFTPKIDRSRTRPRPNLNKVLSVVCARYGTAYEQLFHIDRDNSYAMRVRQLGIWLLYKYTLLRPQDILDAFHLDLNRHATIRHDYKNIENLIKDEPRFGEEAFRLEQQLFSEPSDPEDNRLPPPRLEDVTKFAEQNAEVIGRKLTRPDGTSMINPSFLTGWLVDNVTVPTFYSQSLRVKLLGYKSRQTFNKELQAVVGLIDAEPVFAATTYSIRADFWASHQVASLSQPTQAIVDTANSAQPLKIVQRDRPIRGRPPKKPPSRPAPGLLEIS